MKKVKTVRAWAVYDCSGWPDGRRKPFIDCVQNSKGRFTSLGIYISKGAAEHDHHGFTGRKIVQVLIKPVTNLDA